MERKFTRWVVRSILMALLFSVTFLFVSGAMPRTAWARSSGISGYSGNPATHSGGICTGCHSGGTLPTVALTGPASLAPSASGIYTLTITGGPAVVGGLDVATSAGTLQATDTTTQLLNSEIVHKASTAFSGNTLVFTFTLVAPSSAGQITLYAAGLSANNNGSTSGDNATKTTLTVNVATASAPQIIVTDSVAPANDHQIPFGTVLDGVTSDQTVTVSNNGNANLVIGTIASVNPLAPPFSIPADNCSGKTIAPAGTCTMTVRFAPTSSGAFNASFDIPSDDPSTPSVVVSVSGTGSSASAPQIVVTDSVAPANDHQIPFGTVLDGVTSDQTVTVSNNGNANLVIGTIAIVNPLAPPFSIPADNCSGKTIAPAGTCTMTVRFVPTSSGAFNASFDIPSDDPSTPSVAVSVSGTGDNPPTAPSLVSPADGQTGVKTTTTLQWTGSSDLDGDALTYHLYYCTDRTFVSCPPVNVASRGTTGIYFAGSGLLFIGFVMTRGARGRKFMLMMLIALLLMTGVLIVSCSSGNGGSSTPVANTNMTHQISGLNSATTYYWKVIADDGKGGLTSSATWSFSTQ